MGLVAGMSVYVKRRVRPEYVAKPLFGAGADAYTAAGSEIRAERAAKAAH
jgi:hypothetical protein